MCEVWHPLIPEADVIGESRLAEFTRLWKLLKCSSCHNWTGELRLKGEVSHFHPLIFHETCCKFNRLLPVLKYKFELT